MSEVITPLTKDELNDLFDEHSINVIEFFLKELLMTKPEVLSNQNDIPIYAAQEYVEQWFVQALGAQPVGAGSYPIDILKDKEYGADIKSLTYKIDENGQVSNNQSGEASLGQKFDTDNEHSVLDQLFSEHKREQILTLWKVILNDKYQRVQSKDLDKLPLYFFFILRGPVDFYLTAASVHPENIQNLSVDEYRSTSKSVFVNGYIDTLYGTCKIYKSKKRMELRLRPKKWIDEGRAIKFEIPQHRIEKDLRRLSVNNKLDEYLIEKFQVIKKMDDIVE